MRLKNGLAVLLVAVAFSAAALAVAGSIDLNGSWDFAFAEGSSLEAAGEADFTATDKMSVPGCYDMMPKWLCKRGTGLYRRSFTLDRAVDNAWLVVDGMGLTGRFRIDGKDLGVHPYPYARLELETGPLAAGEHVVFAALDNRFDYETQKLARPYYDFYCHGGFYHGVSLSFDNRKLFVRTRDYRTGTVEVEAVNFAERDFAATLLFDGRNEVAATFRNGRVTVQVPDFRLWSPESPNLHSLSLKLTTNDSPLTTNHYALTTRFGIREVKAENRRLWLNGKPIYLKGANRHEAHPTFGAATPESLMVMDIQNLKAIGGNFFRGCHYQQSQRFLDYCDEMGVLVWEESLGWGNGRNREHGNELKDPVFVEQQVWQTREMVRTSFNHPCVIVFAFMNEFASDTELGKEVADRLIETIRAEDSGRLVSYACCQNKGDVAHANTDVVAFNTYPGWIGSDTGDAENLRRLVFTGVTNVVGRFRSLYPDKPIMVSEMGTCGVYGQHDPAGAQWTEDFQAEYDGAVIDAVFDNPDICGLAIWQFTDARSFHRGGNTIRTKPFALNLAGIYDAYRRPKMAVEVVKAGFARKAKGEPQ